MSVSKQALSLAQEVASKPLEAGARGRGRLYYSMLYYVKYINFALS